MFWLFVDPSDFGNDFKQDLFIFILSGRIHKNFIFKRDIKDDVFRLIMPE